MVDKSTAAATHHHALLIGIDAYPDRPLAGAVQDVVEIEQYLKRAIDPLAIQTLVAPLQSGSDGPSQHEHARVVLARTRPTYKTVTNALREIRTRARKGDYVYIHFSGHGTKNMNDDIEDTYSNRLTGDLALVLLGEDKDKPESYLWGPTLAQCYLNPLVEKGLIVTLVLDCCFSAGVYRQDDRNIRFFPYKTLGTISQQYSPELEEIQEVSATSHITRNVSMRPSWLMNPDGYAILTACGAGQKSGEFQINGVTYGKLSYFLRQSFDRAGGCRKTHAAIYRRLHALFRGRREEQDPVLYGHKEQAFFGDIDIEDCYAFEIVTDRAGKLQLQAGRAHGFCLGDQFLLHPLVEESAPGSRRASVIAKIIELGALSSILESTEETIDNALSINSNPSPITWAASVLTQSSLRAYPVHLPHDVPDRAQLRAALVERSITVHDSQPALHAFYTISGIGQDLEVRNKRGSLLATATYAEVVDQVEHLVRFAMVKDLTNPNPSENFRRYFNIYIKSGGNRFNPSETIVVKDNEDFTLFLENCGPIPLFFSASGLWPDWQVESLFKASYIEVAAPDSTQTHVARSISATTTVPGTVQEKGLQVCDDYLKIFVTSQPSLFESLELPALGQAAEMRRRRESGVLRVSPTLGQSEQWASVMFHMTVSM